MAKDNKKTLVQADNALNQDVVTVPTVTEPKKAPKTVEIEATVLENVLDRLAKVEAEAEVLRKAADKSRLERIEAGRSAGKLLKQVKISVFDQKFVLGWRRLVDEVYFDEHGRLHEDQKIELTFIDGTTKETTDRDFARRKNLIAGEIIKESKDQDGNINLTVLMKDGKEIEIDQTFVN